MELTHLDLLLIMKRLRHLQTWRLVEKVFFLALHLWFLLLLVLGRLITKSFLNCEILLPRLAIKIWFRLPLRRGCSEPLLA